MADGYNLVFSYFLVCFAFNDHLPFSYFLVCFAFNDHLPYYRGGNSRSYRGSAQGRIRVIIQSNRELVVKVQS